jgi:hypothetical protein
MSRRSEGIGRHRKSRPRPGQVLGERRKGPARGGLLRGRVAEVVLAGAVERGARSALSSGELSRPSGADLAAPFVDIAARVQKGSPPPDLGVPNVDPEGTDGEAARPHARPPQPDVVRRSLRTTLADAGQDGWGAAATASCAAFGAVFLLLITVGAALAYSIASSPNHAKNWALD